MSRRAKVILMVLLVVVVLLGLGFWSLLRRGFSAHDRPSAVEEWIARGARNLATPAAAARLKNPQTVSPENIREGMEHFADHCAVCHANDGSGNTVFGSNMYPKPPDMRQPQTQNLSDGEIYYIIQNGIRLTGMPAFGEPNQTDSRESWNLVLFIRHLPKLTPEEEAEMKRLNPKTPAEWQEAQEIERFLAGEDVPPAGEKKEHRH